MQVVATLLLLLLLRPLTRPPEVAATATATARRRLQDQNQKPNSSPHQDVNLEQVEVSALAVGQAQCEPIETKMCERMPYNSTRMPNFFGDPNQFAARQRSLGYLALVESRCSPYIETYLCELLNPICMESSRHFEIYPCRSFCRRLRTDCEHQIQRRPGSLAQAFQCERLPYESNAGDGKLTGPCHEENAQRPRSGYHPYEAEFEYNKPPVITDMSPLDSGLIRPPPPPPPVDIAPLGGGAADMAHHQPPASNPPTGNHQQTLSEQLGTFGSSLVLVLVRYSNQLSVATLICLLLVLNLRRLKRWTRPPRQQSSSAAGKQLGSALLTTNQSTGAGLRSASPSSSSRSLVLYASGGAKNPAGHQHKLLDQHPEPQRLIHGLNQKTLINLNRTLERQHPGQRYLAIGQQQPNDKQRLFDTLDSHSSCHSNQYDYIQVQHPSQSPSARLAATNQQLYSNILLSSPSHQVLLVGGDGGGQRHQSRFYPRTSDGAPAPRGFPPELQQQQQRGFQRRRTMSNAGRATRAPGSSWSSSSGASSSSPPDASSCGRRGPPAQL